MISYRVFSLDDAGKITKSEIVEASTDEEAVQHAGLLDMANHCEVWDRERLVARLSREPDTLPHSPDA